MITLIAKKKGMTDIRLTVFLPWEQRLKSRLRVRLDGGLEAGIFLPRGTVLRGGDVLVSAEGEAVLVRAAVETVSTVRTSDPLLLARLCYHLGNRHVALEIGTGYLRYLHDYVLDGMVHGLGGETVVEEAPFEPEHGAYGEYGGHGGHSHGHGHEHL
jgi:urease accessory protein